MNVFISWLWGSAYGMADVYKLFAGIKRNTRKPFRFLLMMERNASYDGALLPGMERHAIKDPHLLGLPGCLVRLRMFDNGWQANRGLQAADRLICLDLDNVITGPIDALFERDESLVIVQGGNATNPCPYVGAVMMLRPYCNGHVWSDFSLSALAEISFHEFPDDQGWLAHKVPDAGAWRAGSSGIYVFHKPGWPGWPAKCQVRLPPRAAIVCFTGWRKPRKFTHLDWIKENWRYP